MLKWAAIYEFPARRRKSQSRSRPAKLSDAVAQKSVEMKHNLRPGNESYAVFAKGWGVPAHVESNELGEEVSRHLMSTIIASQTVETSVTLEPVPDNEPGK